MNRIHAHILTLALSISEINATENTGVILQENAFPHPTPTEANDFLSREKIVAEILPSLRLWGKETWWSEELETLSNWPPANAVRNGGYLLRFATDIFGNGQQQVFLLHSLQWIDPDHGWTMFVKGKPVATVDLYPYEIHLVRKGETATLYTVRSRYGQASVREQIVSASGKREQIKSIKPEDADSIRESLERNETVIRVSLQAILLYDFAIGSNDWKTVDLMNKTEIEGGGKYFSLKCDYDRLSKLKFTPEDAVRALESTPTKPDGVK